MGKICNNCHHENDETATICSSCGKSLSENQLNNNINKIKKIHTLYKKILLILSVIIFALCLYFVIKKEWTGLFLVLLFGVPIIIKLSANILLNKATEVTLYKANAKYNEYKDNDDNK